MVTFLLNVIMAEVIIVIIMKSTSNLFLLSIRASSISLIFVAMISRPLLEAFSKDRKKPSPFVDSAKISNPEKRCEISSENS